MDLSTFTIDEKILKEILVQIKLNINESLYKDGHISEIMYEKAKELIIKDKH